MSFIERLLGLVKRNPAVEIEIEIAPAAEHESSYDKEAGAFLMPPAPVEVPPPKASPEEKALKVLASRRARKGVQS